ETGLTYNRVPAFKKQRHFTLCELLKKAQSAGKTNLRRQSWGVWVGYGIWRLTLGRDPSIACRPVVGSEVRKKRVMKVPFRDPAGQCSEYGLDDFLSEILPASECGDGVLGTLAGSCRPVKSDYGIVGTRLGSYRSVGKNSAQWLP
ncbi:hypothetical protein NPIL_372811, partial [Nephila pilipes]